MNIYSMFGSLQFQLILKATKRSQFHIDTELKRGVLCIGIVFRRRRLSSSTGHDSNLENVEAATKVSEHAMACKMICVCRHWCVWYLINWTLYAWPVVMGRIAIDTILCFHLWYLTIPWTWPNGCMLLCTTSRCFCDCMHWCAHSVLHCM